MENSIPHPDHSKTLFTVNHHETYLFAVSEVFVGGGSTSSTKSPR